MTWPSRACSSRPPGFLITSLITGLSGSESMITSQRSASSAKLLALVAPQAGIRAGAGSCGAPGSCCAVIRLLLRDEVRTHHPHHCFGLPLPEPSPLNSVNVAFYRVERCRPSLTSVRAPRRAAEDRGGVPVSGSSEPVDGPLCPEERSLTNPTTIRPGQHAVW